jgi:integrase
MAKQLKEKLSDRKVRTAGPGRHGDGKGLWLNVTATGSRAWEFRFQIDNRTRTMFLGNLNDVSLAEARDLAEDARRLVKRKIDPIEHRNAERDAKAAAQARETGAPTFSEAAADFIQRRKDGWSAGSLREWQRTIRDYCHLIADKPVNKITAGDIYAIIDPLWHTKNETAIRLRHRIEKVLSAARSSDSANLFFDANWVNPARWRDHLANHYGPRPKIEPKRHKAMPYEEIPAFVERLRELNTNLTLCQEFMILTCARTEEGRCALWSEIDFEARLWTIPSPRMKGRKSHRVPLSDRAMAILEEMRARSDGRPFIFAGRERGAPIGVSSLRSQLREMGIANASPHGFRSSFKVWATEIARIPDDVSEGCLAHQIGTAVQRAYQRSDMLDRRREALDAWARYLDRRPAQNVLPFGQRAATP